MAKRANIDDSVSLFPFLSILAAVIGILLTHEMGHVPRRGESHRMGGLDFVVLLTKGGAVRWFKVSPVAADDRGG